ncbi:MAG: hypothetical protein ACW98D_16195 [Promethearchaeota archaeon]|jgi:hypothetical protein
MENNNSLDELKKAYNNYKEKNYTFGHYETEEQIENEFSNGKIFVFAGGYTLFKMCIFFLVIATFMVFIIGLEYFIIVFSTFAIIGFCPIVIGFLSLRMFLVIGPSGVYYRRINKTGFFQWSEVTLVKGTIGRVTPPLRPPPVTTAQVTIILSKGEKVRFTSMNYRNKEFPRNIKRKMFIFLFRFYHWSSK